MHRIMADLANIDGKQVPILVTPEYKLKRPKKPARRFKLKELFGFQPEEVIVQLASSRNNAFVLIAVDPKGKTPQGKRLLESLEE